MAKVNEISMPKDDFKAGVKKMIMPGENKKDKEISKSIDKMMDEAKLKLHKGLIINPEDPQKGLWKSNTVNNERELKAAVIEENKGLFQINLQVISTNPKINPLKDGEYLLLI